MNRSESKYQNTANKMCNALIELLETKDFNDISIMDVCEKAGIYRSTFYSHYDNTYDLLNETRTQLIANFLSECDFKTDVSMQNIKNLDKDEVNFITPQYLLPYLNYIKKNKKLFKIYANNIKNYGEDNYDDYFLENLLVPIFAKHGITDKKLILYMQKYYLSGMDAIISEWVRNNCEDDILFICEIITICIRPLSYKNK